MPRVKDILMRRLWIIFPKQWHLVGNNPLMLRNNHEKKFHFWFVGMNNFENPLRNKKVDMVKKKKKEEEEEKLRRWGLMRDGHNHTHR